MTKPEREDIQMDNNMMDSMLATKAQIIVFSADAMKSDTKDGKIEGMSVFYTFNTTFESVCNNPLSYGQKPGKIWMDYERIEKIVSAPGKYIGTFGMKVGSDGKPVLVLKDLDYINDIKLTDVVYPKPEDDPNYPQYAPAPEKKDKPAGK
jgi:hypothetical protein